MPVKFWTVVLGTIATVFYFNPFPMAHFTAIATAATACLHLYFLEELDRQALADLG